MHLFLTERTRWKITGTNQFWGEKQKLSILSDFGSATQIHYLTLYWHSKVTAKREIMIF